MSHDNYVATNKCNLEFDLSERADTVGVLMNDLQHLLLDPDVVDVRYAVVALRKDNSVVCSSTSLKVSEDKLLMDNEVMQIHSLVGHTSALLYRRLHNHLFLDVTDDAVNSPEADVYLSYHVGGGIEFSIQNESSNMSENRWTKINGLNGLERINGTKQK